jgi:predicted small lipoprotein YifL
MKRMIATRSLLLLCVVSALPACGHSGNEKVTSAEVVAAPDLPEGWTRLETKDKRISLGLPHSWKNLDLTRATFSQRVARASQRDSRLSKFQSAADRAASNDELKLMFACETGGRYRPNGSVMETPHSAAKSLDEVVEENNRRIQTGGIRIEKSEVDLPAAHAEKVRYVTTSASTGQPVAHVRYFMLKSGHMFMLSFAIPQSDTDLEAITEQMAKTLKLPD